MLFVLLIVVSALFWWQFAPFGPLGRSGDAACEAHRSTSSIFSNLLNLKKIASIWRSGRSSAS